MYDSLRLELNGLFPAPRTCCTYTLCLCGRRRVLTRRGTPVRYYLLNNFRD